MKENKVFLTTNIKTVYDLKIESEEDMKLIIPFLKSSRSCNILMIEKVSIPKRLFSRVIAFLSDTYELVDSCSKDKNEQIIQVNLDLRLTKVSS